MRLALVALGLAVATTGCSMVSLGYNRLPDLGLIWLQRQVDLDREQAQRVRSEMEGLLQWHRSTQLTPMADLLERWQGLALQDISTEQACLEFAQVRGLLDTLTHQAVPAITRLASSVRPEQWPGLQATQRKGNDEFRRDHLGGPRQASWLGARGNGDTPGMAKRIQTLTDRYMELYGKLSQTQTDLVQQAVRSSAWKPERSLAERERRQTDLLATLKLLQDVPPDGAAAQALVRGWLARLSLSPTPGYAAYSRSLVQEGCTLFAALHQTTTPEQRQAAIATLRGYENDLRGLAVP